MTNTDKERADFDAWWTRYRLGASAFRSMDEDAYAAYRAGREAECAEAVTDEKPIAWMNADHVELYRQGHTVKGIVWAAQKRSNLYGVPYTIPVYTHPPKSEMSQDAVEAALEIACAVDGITPQQRDRLHSDIVSLIRQTKPEPSPDVEALRTALEEAEELLALVEMPSFPDPRHHDRVKSLGREIGFGALMSTASAGWREVSEAKGYPSGGEFVAGPCLGSVQRTLRIIRAALSKPEGK
ncbi:hypothetical protein [Chelatococcus sp.]|uniref:hypothetical protein n=1 Tax=Chelatococcus sp. TaxID=1953771 RepID=UPI001ED5BA57|nr:hypothetical protein [Chelatococcus sp.]MBX3547456.1 hypothetical protein [Chelatococcus sp.]CAH1678348.1 hypothetical protein CHELA41_24523 [Hyphomicrobiales bacterium]